MFLTRFNKKKKNKKKLKKNNILNHFIKGRRLYKS